MDKPKPDTKPQSVASKETGQPKKKPTPEQYILDHPHLPNEWWTDEQIHAHADAAHRHYKANTLEFWVWQYCIDNDLPKTTVQRWIANNDYFAKKWVLIKMICEGRLFKFGCSKDVNSSMFRFGLKNAHGWRDDPDDSDPDDHELTVEHGDFAENV
jgi:hypothetical protein